MKTQNIITTPKILPVPLPGHHVSPTACPSSTVHQLFILEIFVNGITQHVPFCVCLLSLSMMLVRLIRVVVSCRNFLIFIMYISFYWKDIWVVFSLGLL